MAKQPLYPFFIVMALLVAASLVLAYSVNVRTTDEAGVIMALPDQVGEWQGSEILFCQNRMCGKDFTLLQLNGATNCPACGGALLTMSWGERDMLPADTEIIKKRYVSPNGETYFVSIVLSGKERVSIHRPEVCLPAAGNELLGRVLLEVPVAGRAPLEVALLDMTRHGRFDNGRVYGTPSFYAYWFVGKNRETPHHWQRMLWMGTDRVFHNVTHRWAYIAVAGMRQRWDDRYRERLKDFIGQLYPHLLRDG